MQSSIVTPHRAIEQLYTLHACPSIEVIWRLGGPLSNEVKPKRDAWLHCIVFDESLMCAGRSRESAVKFGGTIISSQKIKDGHLIFLDLPDQSILAVTEMPTPRNKKELRT